MKIIIKIVKNIVLFIVVLTLAYFSSAYFGWLYGVISHDYGTWIDLSSLIGLSFGYVFFLPLIFTAFSSSKKYWWIGILLIPVAIFEVYFDWEHIYIPIIIGFIGWLIGFVISKIIKKLTSVNL